MKLVGLKETGQGQLVAFLVVVGYAQEETGCVLMLYGVEGR